MLNLFKRNSGLQDPEQLPGDQVMQEVETFLEENPEAGHIIVKVFDADAANLIKTFLSNHVKLLRYKAKILKQDPIASQELEADLYLKDAALCETLADMFSVDPLEDEQIIDPNKPLTQTRW